MENKVISIYTIAKIAGVSPSTVSRVLTGNAKVSLEKKEAVEKIIKQYDFKPNALARGLSNKRTKMIGLIVEDINNPYYANLVVKCEKAAEKEGFMLLVCNSITDSKRQIDMLHRLYEQKVEAIILIGSQVDLFKVDINYIHSINTVANQIPIILLGNIEGADVLPINFDHGKSLEVLLEYLLSLGHKEVLLLGGVDISRSTFEKRIRYTQIMRKHGLRYEGKHIIDCNYDVASGKEAILKYYKEHNKIPSAVIGINDMVAVGAMKALLELGIDVPGQVSVVGIDNTSIGDISIPALTSVGFDYEEVAHAIIQLSLKKINKEKVEYIKMFSPNLVIRESCKSVEKK